MNLLKVPSSNDIISTLQSGVSPDMPEATSIHINTLESEDYTIGHLI
jgi:hypothetical protein